MSKISETSYYCGLIEDKIISLVNNLLKLHKFELIINDSQLYEHKDTFKLKNEMTEYQQQLYVFFIMLDSNQFLKFFITFRNWQEIVVQACEIHSYKTLLNSHK